MYFCYICNNCFVKLCELISHLKYKEFVKEKSHTKIKCVADKNCKNSFQTFYALKTHLSKCHTTQIETSGAQAVEQPVNTTGILHKIDVDCRPTCLDKPAETITPTLNEFDNCIKSFYLKLNELGLPEETLSKIFCESKALTECAINIVSAPTEFENLTYNKLKISDTLQKFSSKNNRKKCSQEIHFMLNRNQFLLGLGGSYDLIRNLQRTQEK